MGAWISSVFGWLAGFGAAAVRRLARWVREALMSLWHHIQSVGRLARRRFFNLLRNLNNLSVALSMWVGSLRRSIRDLYNRFVPRVIRNAINSVFRWARRELNGVVNWAASFIRTVRRWLSDRIDAARSFIQNVWNWAARQLSRLRRFVNGLIDNIQHVLGTPRRLANWLIGAMVEALWRYVQRNQLRIARWFRDRSLAATVFVAGRLESLIRRVL